MFKYETDLKGRRIAFFGRVSGWSFELFDESSQEHVWSRGGVVANKVDDTLDYLVLGEGRAKGKADAQRKAKALSNQGSLLEVLDSRGFIELVSPSIDGCSFAFAGGFSYRGFSRGPEELLAQHQVELDAHISPELNYLVIGEGRKKGKADALKKVQKLADAGTPVTVLSERAFLDLVDCVNRAGLVTDDFDSFAVQLRSLANPRRVDRAIEMLKRERFDLYADVTSDRLGGIVKSQTQSNKLYACWLEANGTYSCRDGGLDVCMGLQGDVCKHILVLVIGLCHNGKIPANSAHTWVSAACNKRPVLTESLTEAHSAELILRYKGAMSGELDWRPTETVPEDYYAL